MQAVILAGGLGTRMREETEFRPKPMVELGGKPVLWHIMKILASQGINEFIVCAGYKQEIVRDYFLNLREKSQDFTIDFSRGAQVTFHDDFQEANWKVTVVDTGAYTMTGGRVKQISRFLREDSFLITYGDGLADIDLKALVESHKKSNATLTLSTSIPRSRFGVVASDESGKVSSFLEKPRSSEKVNIGFMIAEHALFNYLNDDSILEGEPIQNLVQEGRVNSYLHEGFWQPMDTQRELQTLNQLWAEGAPWKIW